VAIDKNLRGFQNLEGLVPFREKTFKVFKTLYGLAPISGKNLPGF
jgi:hypothetical protein